MLIRLCKILMVFNLYNMTHYTTLNPQFEDTIVTATSLIYYKDAIKKKHAICQNVSVLLSSALSDFSLRKLTCLHVHPSTTSEPTQGPLQKRKLSHWPLMWQGHIDNYPLANFDKIGYLSSFAFHHNNGLVFNRMVSSTL